MALALAESRRAGKYADPAAMNYYGSSEEHGPVTWFRGHAIYAAHFVVLVFSVSLLITTGLLAMRLGGVAEWLVFRSDLVWRDEVWRLFTYGFWNPPGPGWAGVQFILDMLMIVWFGREVEKFIGRRKFLTLFVCIYVLPPLLLTAFGRWWPSLLIGESGAFAIFIAFATLFPNAAIFFAILAKWAAVALLGIATLGCLAYHDWSTLVALWSTSAFAYAYIRHHQGLLELPRFRLPRRKPKLRAVPDLPATARTRPQPSETSTAEIDALLDKIAQSGFASLTPKERAKLESARQQLKNRSSR